MDLFEESGTRVVKSTPFITAFRFSLSVSECEKETKADIKSVLNSLEAAAGKLGFLNMPIGDIQVMHIKLSLDECRKISSKFSAKRFNKAKAYISGLYKYLVEVGAAYANMAKAISPIKKVMVTKPVFISDEEMIRIMNHLEKVNKRFYVFVTIFYYSGGRIKELMKLQVKDVNLVKQTYSSYILKGNVGWTDRTIRNNVLPVWREHIKNAKPNDYVFSKYLIPGSLMIRSDQATRRWTKYVMIPLNINATFYKLKHRAATRTNEVAGIELSAAQMGHVNTDMARTKYVIGEQERIKKEQHELLKVLDMEM